MKNVIQAWAISGMLVCGIVSAQAPVAPAAPTTLWNFLGIPQGFNKLRDATVNTRGNHPRLERKPPLKSIADPANLLSDNKAIKAAAEIKQAEDMKQQKVKAIKFLATIGCGCYNKNGEVTDALIAAMDDCTEEVRFQAVQAVIDASQSEQCVNCKTRSCCSKKMMKKLYEIAYERGDDCCFLEPSERIRELAMQAMRLCGCGGIVVDDLKEEKEEEEEKKEEKEMPDDKEKPKTDDDKEKAPELLPPAEKDANSVRFNLSSPTVRAKQAPASSLSVPTTFASEPRRLTGVQYSLSDQSPEPTASEFAPVVSKQQASPRTNEPNASKPSVSTKPAGSSNSVQAKPISHTTEVASGKPLVATRSVQPAMFGRVEIINVQDNMVGVQLEGQSVLPKGTRIKAYRHYLTGRMKVGELEVIDADAGRAVCRPVDGLTVAKLEIGLEVMAVR